MPHPQSAAPQGDRGASFADRGDVSGRAAPRHRRLAPVTPRTKPEGLPFILPNEAHALRRLIERALGRTRLTIAAQTDGMITTRALVSAGQGYTILPYGAIHQQLSAGQLSAARLRDIDIPWTLGLACWKDQRGGRAVQAVRDILTTHFDRLGDDPRWGTVPAKAALKGGRPPRPR